MTDPLPSLLSILLVFVLVLLNGFFVAAEFAMVKIRSSRLETLVDEGNTRARFAQSIVNNLDAYLSACQLGITLASLGLGWIGEPAIADLIRPVFTAIGWNNEIAIHSVSIAIAFIIITILHIVLGELAPKSLAIRKAETVTLWTAAPMLLFHKIMYPFIWMLNGMANALLKLFGIAPASEHESAHTEEEIRILMKESNKSGLIDNTELALVDNIFEFADTTAHEIMIPRTEMICLSLHASREENLQIALNGMCTRYPVCDGDKDHIVGFLHIKDLLRYQIIDSVKLIRPIIAVPESIKISELMKLMQRGKTQIAILIDEYGGTAGLVTLEDIMEEIVGEIQDEFDHERPIIEPINEMMYSIDGMMLIEEFNTRFSLDLDMSEYDTIGGWLYSRVESLPPKVGQSVAHDGHLLVVEEVENKRISRIKLVITQFAVTTNQAGA
ncbi:hemolysin family protein [Paenibacillus campi]|uniref:hemolysin family protein n=1 Tax=Paenibacillus campi TaxID=3106031 RepID=UPI002B00063F|nr:MULTISPECIES: hemolysin family protein [unclassified Paenibacillus]